jgi:hypothetical protein
MRYGFEAEAWRGGTMSDGPNLCARRILVNLTLDDALLETESLSSIVNRLG